MEQVVKINLPGGFVSAGDLYEILVIAENAGAKNIRFGNRQQLYFSADEDCLDDMGNEMLQAEIQFEVNDDSCPNIMSSYVADSIFNQEGWLREGVYKDILDLFNYKPQLKINIVDSQQSFVPFFSGNINFIASETSNYWFMYIRFPKSVKHYCCPSLIYSGDIPVVAKLCEDIILGNKDIFYNQKEIDELRFFKIFLENKDIAYQPIVEELKLPDFYLPYYEGFNKYNNRYWLGIYRRNEYFSIAFLKDACSLCLKTRIGQIYTTPWKSIIIKGIEPANRPEWGMILGKYHLNIRHAANELNWQIEDLCEEGLELKKQLVREFEEADLRTYQLCFAIKTRPNSGLPGSVIIKKSGTGLFDVLHTKDFNPNSKDYVIYLRGLNQKQLSIKLILLCNNFYDAQSTNIPIDEPVQIINESTHYQVNEIYACNNCLTRYDMLFGDYLNGIEKNIEFENLPEYFCPVCEAPKSEFSLVETKQTA